MDLLIAQVVFLIALLRDGTLTGSFHCTSEGWLLKAELGGLTG